MQHMRSTDTDISLASILAMIWRRKALIILCLCGSLGVAFASLSYVHPRYTASIAILLDPKGPDSVDPGGEFASRPVDSVKIGSVVSVMESNSLLDRVVRSEHLIDDPEFKPSRDAVGQYLRALIPSKKSLNDASQAGQIAAASDILHKMMKVTRDGFTYVIKIDVVSGDPQKAKRLAQAIGDAYLNDQIETKYGNARQNFKWLSERLDQMKSELIASEDTVQRIRRAHGITETEKGSDMTFAAQEIAEVGKQLVVAQADFTQKEARARFAEALQTKSGDMSSFPEVASSPTVVQLKQRQAEAVRKQLETSRHYGARHPEAVRAENEVGRATADLADEIKRIVTASDGEYRAALLRVSSLQVQMKKLGERDEKSADGLGSLHQAQRVAEANRRLYDSFLNRFKEIEHRQTIGEVEARIISAPRLPMDVSFPRPLPFLLGGIGFGLVLGLSAAFLREYTETTFSTPAQVEQALGVPVLAVVPLLKRRDLWADGKRLSIIEYIAKNPISTYADSLRGIRLGLQCGGPSRARIVNFASSMPDEGKSTLAACVAISAARAGAKTILIDCDLRNSSTSDMFECSNRPGTADVVAGSSTFEEVIVPTTIPSLSIVPVGSYTPRSPDLVNSKRLKQLILSAAEVADFVVIDSAAIEQVPDAIVPSQIADETVLVVKWRASDRAYASRAVDQLERINAKLTGIVFNSVDMKKAAKYGYGSKSYVRRHNLISSTQEGAHLCD